MKAVCAEAVTCLVRESSHQARSRWCLRYRGDRCDRGEGTVANARRRYLVRVAESRPHDDRPGWQAGTHPLAVGVVPGCADDGSDGSGLRGG